MPFKTAEHTAPYKILILRFLAFDRRLGIVAFQIKQCKMKHQFTKTDIYFSKTTYNKTKAAVDKEMKM